MNRLPSMLLVLLAAGCALEAEPAPVEKLEIEWTRYYAREYGVPAELVIAIIDVESGWDPLAVSEKGAAGLMQLLPATAWRFGVTNRFVVPENIRGGVAYLAYLMHQFGGDLRLVAAAYYGGEKHIQTARLNCDDPAIYRYVVAVQHAYCRALVSGSNRPTEEARIHETDHMLDGGVGRMRRYHLQRSDSAGPAPGHRSRGARRTGHDRLPGTAIRDGNTDARRD